MVATDVMKPLIPLFLQWYPEIRGCQTMWILPVVSSILAAVVRRPVPHGTLLGLIPPAIAFTTVKGHSMPWPWNGDSNLSAFEKQLNAAPSSGVAQTQQIA
jgi:hypothetical protein